MLWSPRKSAWPACVPTCPPAFRLLPTASTISHKQRLWRKVLLLNFAQSPSHPTGSFLFFLTQHSLKGSPGIKDIIPDSGSSHTTWKGEPMTYLRKCTVTHHTGWDKQTRRDSKLGQILSMSEGEKNASLITALSCFSFP